MVTSQPSVQVHLPPTRVRRPRGLQPTPTTHVRIPDLPARSYAIRPYLQQAIPAPVACMHPSIYVREPDDAQDDDDWEYAQRTKE